mgnify:CR=1 FL=1
MAITCTISKRSNNINSDAEPVYHLKPIVNNTITMDALAKRISDSCTLTHADVVACLNALNHELLRALLDGDKVDMAWLGTFKVALETQSQTAPEQCSKTDVKKIKVNYQPSKPLKTHLQSQATVVLKPDAKQRYHNG